MSLTIEQVKGKKRAPEDNRIFRSPFFMSGIFA